MRSLTYSMTDHVDLKENSLYVNMIRPFKSYRTTFKSSIIKVHSLNEIIDKYTCIQILIYFCIVERKLTHKLLILKILSTVHLIRIRLFIRNASTSKSNSNATDKG